MSSLLNRYLTFKTIAVTPICSTSQASYILTDSIVLSLSASNKSKSEQVLALEKASSKAVEHFICPLRPAHNESCSLLWAHRGELSSDG